MKKIIAWTSFVALSAAFVFGLYWLAKTGSYLFFYESMVQETIREMVKPEFLRSN